MMERKDREQVEKTEKNITEELENEELETEAEAEVVEDLEEETAEEMAEESEEEPEEETDEEPEKEPEKETEETGEKKGFFGKKKKDKKDEQLEALNDKYTRLFAEFDNFRKRSEKEKAAMFDMGSKNVIEKILPVIDNFERGLAQVPEDRKDDPFVDGMDKVYKGLSKALEDLGVTPIEAVGQEFDPELHNAVMHEDNDEVGDNIITEEYQKGYKYHELVVRHSMVKVAN